MEVLVFLDDTVCFQTLTEGFGQILATCSSQFVLSYLSSPVLSPLLFSISLVSYVQLCLQTRLR